VHNQATSANTRLLWHEVKESFDPEHPEYAVDAEGRNCLVVDSCIAHVLELLWAHGIVTRSSCCGDGSGHGVISIRTLSADTERKLIAAAVRGSEARLRRLERGRRFDGSRVDRSCAHAPDT
jgi:hypothetical protein